jgi:uncharacterized SAM-dependent methyltransferase
MHIFAGGTEMSTFTVGLMYQFESSYYTKTWLETHVQRACIESEKELSKLYPGCRIKIENLESKYGRSQSKTTVKDNVSELIRNLDLVIFEFSDNNPNVMIEFGIRISLNKPYLIIKNEDSPKPLPSNISNDYYTSYNKEHTYFSSTLAELIIKTASANVSRKSDKPHNGLNKDVPIIHKSVSKTNKFVGKLLDIFVDFRATAEMKQEFDEDVRRRHIGEKFRYTGFDEALAWRNLCMDADYRPYWDSVELLQSRMSSILEGVYTPERKEIDFFCLGVGSGMKEKVVIKRILRNQSKLDFYLVDASIEMICFSLMFYSQQLNGYEENISWRGIMGDFTSNLPPIPKIHKGRTGLYALLGNTIGNYPEYLLLDAINGMMEAGDYVMIDAQILPNKDDKEIKKEIARSYDNPLLRKFVMTSLQRIKGFSEDCGEVDVIIEDKHHDFEHEHAYTVKYDWVFGKNTKFGGYEYKKNQHIGLGFSVKYDLDLLCKIINDCGFIVKNRHIHKNKYYAIVLAQKG